MSKERSPPDRDYVSFLLRLWREDLNGHSSWHALLQDAQTMEKQYFADVSTLLDTLADRFMNQYHQQQSKPISDGKSKEVTDDAP